MKFQKSRGLYQSQQVFVVKKSNKYIFKISPRLRLKSNDTLENTKEVLQGFTRFVRKKKTARTVWV